MKSIFAILFLVTLATSFSAEARNVSFDVGSEPKATELNGSVRVECRDPRGGWDVGHFRCYAEVLDPAEFSYFKIEGKVDADRVTLVARHADGSTRTKSEKFDAAKSRSKDRFNLWIHTLLQKPLLEYGKNTIAYQLEKGSKVVERGQFEVTVKDGGQRSCRHRSYWSNNINDCRTGGLVCDQYFRDENYCE